MYPAQKMRAASAARVVDEQLRNAFASLNNNLKRHVAFHGLVAHVRSVSNLLGPYRGTGYVGWIGVETAIEGLLAMSSYYRDWVRDPQAWRPEQQSQRRLLGSLARHLLATHDVPKFMDHVWWDLGEAADYRDWYRHVGLGNSIRGIYKGKLTKEQAQRFLAAPDHLSTEQALIWCRSDPAESKTRKVVYPMGPSRRRLKRRRASVSRDEKVWPRIGIADFFYLQMDEHTETRSWFIRQIRTKTELVREGREMSHCVGSYDWECDEGQTTIWSMQSKTAPFSRRRVLTIEVDPKKRTVETALGYKNRQPTDEEMAILKKWMEREAVTFGRWV
ncbi:MAG: PcfJ domain-containing protein [Planctomycetota bacterium]